MIESKGMWMKNIFDTYTGTPIIVTPDKKKQNRIHKKKRINKKWAKRYRYTIHNLFKDDEIITMSGSMYMNPRTYYKVKSLVPYT